MPVSTRSCAALLVCLCACGGLADLQSAGPEPFMAVSRADALSGQADAGPEVVGSSEHFYVAIAKSELGKKWFMSAYLTQWYPSENTPMRSLGTRVVSFAVQNGTLFVFDAADGKGWSDTLDPTVIIEAYPLVTDYAPFNALPNASSYVLFDPARGLNKFNLVSDEFAAWYYVKFEIALSFLQRFRTLPDGAAWEQVFTGHSDLPGPGILSYDQPFQGSGTLSFTLRRYRESPDFTPTTFGSSQQFYFPSASWQLVKNEPRYERKTVKWNVHPGMQPIEWRLSSELWALQADAQYQGVDVAGAITRGVEGWNDAFGFPVFRVVSTTQGEGPGDDDKNFVVVDRNPGAGLAFANWRENPNTGEIRGASVYFSSAFIQGALIESADAGALEPIDAGQPPPPPPAPIDAGPPVVPCAPALVISQLFGANSLTSALNQDFVELHNRTDQAVPLAGWSLQYASASGSASWQVVALSGTVPPNGFFLVGLASAGDGGTPLAGADLTAGLNISGTSGKLALVASVAPLSGVCPATGAAVDFVGYGSANCSEGLPAPAASAATAVMRRDVCVDSSVNAADFLAGAPSPRSSGEGPLACTCLGPAPVGPADAGSLGPVLGSADAGVLGGVPSARPALGRIGWEAMTSPSVCALHGKPLQIPAGMTRREYVEKVIEHTISHEIGHTLGLRHNFKGSLEGSSVMDYLTDDEAAKAPRPGAFDVAAVRFLYGLDPSPPGQAFCTDESRATDAQCDIWDTGANPLTTQLAPQYSAKVRAMLAGTGQVTYADLWKLTRYVRAPASEAQRLEALDALLADVAPPLKPEIVALGPSAAGLADVVAWVTLGNLFTDPAGLRDEVKVSPALADAAFRARVIEVAKNIVINSDGRRSFEARRAAVDVLKALQTYDALDALVAAKPALAAERATYNASGQALIDDLSRRIDLAMSPYFH